jgi:hypothetical protein
MKRIANVALRIAALAVRFLFIFFLAKQIDADALGYYGIFTGYVAFGLVFVGLEFFVYVTRDLLNAPEEDRGKMLKGHAVLSGCIYLALLPAIAAFLSQADWPDHLYLWFVPILVLEHLNQEVYRLLVTMSEQITASALLFMRQASWPIALIILTVALDTTLTLDTIMFFWFVAGLISIVLGIAKVRRIGIGGWHKPLEWAWIRRGLMVATPFLLATLAQRGIFTFDRYWLEAIGGPEVVGAYVLFFGMASALTVILDAAVTSFFYPELIKLQHNKQEHQLARLKVKSMLYQTLAISLVFDAISWAALPLLLGWIDRPIYEQFVGLYPPVLMAVTLLAISQVPHWVLYAQGKDGVIVIANVMALAVFCVCTLATKEIFGIYAVLIGMNAAFFLMLLWKSVAYARLNKIYHADSR